MNGGPIPRSSLKTTPGPVAIGTTWWVAFANVPRGAIGWWHRYFLRPGWRHVLAWRADTGDRAWASEWVETLVVLQGVAVTPDHRNAISRQVSLMAAAPGRALSDFVSGVQMREIKDALHHYTVDGPMGHLLDAERDGLVLGGFQPFEIEELMNMGERSLVPVLTYLFRRIEKRLTGAPSRCLRRGYLRQRRTGVALPRRAR